MSRPAFHLYFRDITTISSYFPPYSRLNHSDNEQRCVKKKAEVVAVQPLFQNMPGDDSPWILLQLTTGCRRSCPRPDAVWSVWRVCTVTVRADFTSQDLSPVILLHLVCQSVQPPCKPSTLPPVPSSSLALFLLQNTSSDLFPFLAGLSFPSAGQGMGRRHGSSLHPSPPASLAQTLTLHPSAQEVSK